MPLPLTYGSSDLFATSIDLPGVAAVIAAIGSILIGVLTGILTYLAGRSKAKVRDADTAAVVGAPSPPETSSEGYSDTMAQLTQELLKELLAVRKERDGVLRRLAQFESVHNGCDDPVAKAAGGRHGDDDGE